MLFTLVSLYSRKKKIVKKKNHHVLENGALCKNYEVSKSWLKMTLNQKFMVL